MNAAELVGAQALAALRGKRLLLAGASGNNGSAVLRRLRELGLPVRAMSRRGVAAAPASGAGGRLDEGVEWVAADVTDPASLPRALAGIDIVISAVAGKPFGGPPPEAIDYRGTAHLAAAAREAGVGRFVIITSSVSGRRGGLINLIGRNVIVWKGKAEDALVESGLEYVIVGPARMTNAAGATRRLRVIPRASYERSMTVSRDDLASVVVAVAGLPDAANRAFSVINTDGPADAAWPQDLLRMPAR